MNYNVELVNSVFLIDTTKYNNCIAFFKFINIIFIISVQFNLLCQSQKGLGIYFKISEHSTYLHQVKLNVPNCFISSKI